MDSSEERIRKLRKEVQSLRSLLERTQKERETGSSQKDLKAHSNNHKRRAKAKEKTDDDIPPF